MLGGSSSLCSAMKRRIRLEEVVPSTSSYLDSEIGLSAYFKLSNQLFCFVLMACSTCTCTCFFFWQEKRLVIKNGRLIWAILPQSDMKMKVKGNAYLSKSGTPASHLHLWLLSPPSIKKLPNDKRVLPCMYGNITLSFQCQNLFKKHAWTPFEQITQIWRTFCAWRHW